MQLEGMPPPYWLQSNGRFYVKNQAIPVSHLRSLYEFLVSVEAYYMQKIIIIAPNSVLTYCISNIDN